MRDIPCLGYCPDGAHEAILCYERATPLRRTGLLCAFVQHDHFVLQEKVLQEVPEKHPLQKLSETQVALQPITRWYG
jgi:hypothetical protein